MKSGTSIGLVLLAGVLLVQPAAAAQPLMARMKGAAQNAKIQLQGRASFTGWLLANKEVRARYRAEAKVAGVGKARRWMLFNGGLATVNLLTMFKGNLVGAYLGPFFGVSAVTDAVKVSKGKATARFNTISGELASGHEVPKSVLRMYVKDADRRLEKEQKALVEARTNLANAQTELATKEQLIPTIQARRQQAATALQAR